MKKHTILQILPSLGPQGGVERGTLEMAKYIAEQGYTSLVASAGGAQAQKLPPLQAEHITLPLSTKNPLVILLNAARLAKLIKTRHISLVHARSRAPAWSAYIACKLTKTPFVTTFHGTYSLKGPCKRLYNSVMTRGNAVIAISEFVRRHITKHYNIPSEAIALAPRGVDTAYFTPSEAALQAEAQALRKAWNVPTNTTLFLLPGRITRWKGQDVFLKALKELAEDPTLPPWHAVLVGGADKKAALLNELTLYTQENKLTDDVTFAGTHTNIRLAYAAADVVISASTRPEAFGRIAIEAQAMKKPIIATAHGGSLETVKEGETGFLVPPNDAQAMAKILRRLLEKKEERQAMGDNGYKHVHTHFTTQQMCEAEFGVYKNLLEPKK